MADYTYKSLDDLESSKRVIVKTYEVPATTKTEEFSIDEKENELISLKEQQANLTSQIKELEAEIGTIKTALAIK